MHKLSKFNVDFEFRGHRFIYNSASGALAEVTERSLPCNDQAIKAGFFVPEEADEVELVVQNMHRNMELPLEGLDITVVLTERCNFRCVYCYQDKARDAFFTLEDVYLLVQKIKQAVAGGVKDVYLHYFGGEPLLNKTVMFDLHRRLVSLAHEMSFHYHPVVTTNGSLLDKETLDIMNFETLQLTFDGDASCHDSLKVNTQLDYKGLLTKCLLVLGHPITHLRIRFNLCRENVQTFKGVIREIFALSNIDKDRISFQIHDLINLTNANGFSELDMKDYAAAWWELYLELSKYGKKLFLPTVLTQPCKFMTGRAVCFGAGLKSMFCTTDFTEVVNDIFERPFAPGQKVLQLPPGCDDCNVFPLCLGGCKVQQQSGRHCSPWKYVLTDVLKTYLEKPQLFAVPGRKE